MSKAFAVFVIVVLLAIVTHAWTDVGHILTAEIARRSLNPDHVTKLNQIAGTFNPYFNGRDITKFPYLATFMDEIKLDTHLFDSMHFIDFPYQIGGDYEAPEAESVNGIQAMTEAARTLIFAKDQTKNPGVWGKAFSLLLFVHVFGDIHQPLHAVSLFSEEFTPPVGDMGGNKWRIDYTSEVDNKTYTQMHLLFDCIGGIYPCVYMPHPVSNDFEKDIKRYADSLIAEYPIEQFQDQLKFNFTTDTELLDHLTAFARESFELAKVAYDSYPLDGKIDHKKIQWARSMLRRQIALAGYRMAVILERVDTRITNSPDRTSIPAFWRILCIIAIVVSLAALVGLVLTYRKYKDYKQLAAKETSANYDSLINE